jgi:hypothetical protein
MKGTIAKCLSEMVVEKFGKDKWEAVLQLGGQARSAIFMPQQDVDDGAILKLVDSACKILGVTPVQAADAFGEYWMNVYAPKLYRPFLDGCKTARDFLLKLNDMHKSMTKNMPGARPPSFAFQWKDENTLVLSYQSQRGLIDFAVGLAKGVGKYYQTPLKVTKINARQVQVVF